MAKVWVLQHHPAENLGAIADALESAALAWQYVRVFDGQPVPADMKGAGGLIVMGGPESVYQLDRYPYLRAEMALIESALKAGRPEEAARLLGHWWRVEGAVAPGDRRRAHSARPYTDVTGYGSTCLGYDLARADFTDDFTVNQHYT